MYGIKDFVPPVAGDYRITSKEGNRSSRKTTNGKRMSSFHHGSDWASAKPGSKPDIRNITSGKVVYTGKAGGYGNVVIVENADGYLVQYAHLDSIAVKVGDQLQAGSKVGVMGETGNVTGVHLDLTVTKNGKTITRDGTELAAAPSSILRRAKAKSSTPTEQTTTAEVKSPTQLSKPIVPDNTTTKVGSADMFSNEPITFLQGGVGIAIPETESQNTMFSGVAAMSLDKELESIYAEAARAIADAKDSINSRPMVQSTNPLRAELSSIFDRLEV